MVDGRAGKGYGDRMGTIWTIVAILAALGVGIAIGYKLANRNLVEDDDDIQPFITRQDRN